MVIIFDGKTVALQKEKELLKIIQKNGRSIKPPLLVSFQISKNQASEKYLALKLKAADRLGFKFRVINFVQNTNREIIKEKIKTEGGRKKNDGVMIQLPLAKNYLKYTNEFINLIESTKDIDGMRDDSEFTAPVVLAIDEVLKSAIQKVFKNKQKKYKCLVVGAKGFVGKKLCQFLIKNHKSILDVKGVDFGTTNLAKESKEADILISTTGKKDLIKPDMVKEGVVLIDVGAPDGDIQKEAYAKASFVSPVPGGVGPITIYFLMENLYKAVNN